MRKYNIRVSLNFVGKVQVMADNRQEAEEYTKENFFGILSDVGDKTDERFTDWDVETTGHSEIL